MTPATLAARLRSVLSRSAPSVGVEIGAHHVTAVTVAPNRGAAVLSAYATEPLPAQAVTPAVNGKNVHDPLAVGEALKRALDGLPRRPTRIALVVPDSVAKVSLVRFEHVPARARDLDELIRWQVRKAAPFRIEDAQVSYTPGVATPEGGREFIVALMRRDIVEEYERLCTGAGAHAGIVDLASFNLINAVVAGRSDVATSADWLLVNVTADYSTIAIVRGDDLIFFRNRPAEGNGNLADLVHQTTMYYEDRLGGSGFGRVILAGLASHPNLEGDPGSVRRGLEDRLGTRVESIDPRPAAALPDHIGATPDLLDRLAAPVGLLLRREGLRVRY